MTVVSIKEARSKIGRLIEKAEHGEKIKPQGDFRKSIKVSGTPMSAIVKKNRSEERY